ncbi:MAG TPA: GNAT family N-acetyltransferase, partial [Anaerolineae bacterium]|nr:GNAT family N-acetyltransferase [Anaerolineae bacterium]
SCRIEFLNSFFDHERDEETELLSKEIKEYLLQAIPSNTFIAWIAELEGKLAGTSGMAIWQVLPKYSAPSGKIGYILNMYTLPEMRGKGIGTRLLNELIGEAKSMGLDYLNLHASKEGMKMYRKAGFIEYQQVELGLKLK